MAIERNAGFINSKYPIPYMQIISDWGRWNALPAYLKNGLTQIGYAPDRVIIRHFNKNRTSILIATGTDRDPQSKVWDFPPDYDHTHDVAPVNPAQITYARTAYWKKDEMVCELYTDPNAYIEFDYLRGKDDTDATAIYNVDGLKRTAENEYSFLWNPKDALLAIYWVG